MTPRLIGLIGKKRSGKDTFAAGLIDRGFTRFAFADALKDAALALDPIIVTGDPVHITPSNIDTHGLPRLSAVVAARGWEDAKAIPEVRRTLQALGVAMRDNVADDVWVAGTMARAVDHPGPAVITDVRFPNEAQAVVDAGGIIVRIIRPGIVSDDTHVSETALDGYPADLIIHNDTSADDLVALARDMAF